MIQSIAACDVVPGDKIDNWTVTDVSQSVAFANSIYIHVMWRPTTRSDVRTDVKHYRALDTVRVDRIASREERRAEWQVINGLAER